MAQENGQVADYKQSVKKDDWIQNQSGAFQFIVPAFGWDGNGRQRYPALPQWLPGYSRYSFYSNRDWTLLQTPEHEAMWANAIAIATTQAVSWGWEIEGSVPLQQKKGQQILNQSTAGTFVGWVPFITAHLRSYLTLGRAHIELERQKKAGFMSKVVAMHHLNPLRCRLTDNPRKPIEYLDRRGQTHALNYYDCLSFADGLDPTEGEQKWVEGAAERAYNRIVVAEAVMRFLFEKITGARATSIEFIQGITAKALKDVIQGSDDAMAQKGSILYKGVVAVPIPGDIPVQRVSIPISEIPDGFNAQEIRDDATIAYAASIGLDVADLDPRLAQRTGLGSGAQAVVLDQKTKGKGLVAWRRDWLEKMNQWVLGNATKFVWSERSLEDEQKKAQTNKTRAETIKLLQESQVITGDQARNLLVDEGVLPREFLQKDATPNALSGADKPTEDAPESREAAPQVQQPVEAKKEYLSIEALMRQEMSRARKLAEGVTEKETAVWLDESAEMPDAWQEFVNKLKASDEEE